ncbi:MULTISPECIES: TorF family putative porin [unclassified Dyella]|uniref:TorF family putative porin n=1 Tax=unclassified Dyella TaxID=2634549 RepID=UPI000CAB0B48|nr:MULTISPECIES: TorF family putative porin [unclassified Dyella]MDR3445061.1 TorF family putative porin [Dyella sp.]PMQ04982.1 hypothetical protein DyAD56_11525 [Dyella sp. AD56]
MKKILSFTLVSMLAGASSLLHAQDTVGGGPADGGTPPPIPSQPAPDTWQVAFNVGAQSDYIFRGISQTNEHPSGFAGLDVTAKGAFYAGVWTSNVDFSPSGDTRTRQEVDLYGGWRPTFAGITFDLGYIHYGYLHQPKEMTESYAETYLRGSHAFGPVTLGGAVYYSPNFPGIARHAVYAEGNVAYTIDPAWTVSVAMGRQTIGSSVMRDDGSRADFSYNTWNAGVTWTIRDGLSLDLRYWDTNAHDSGHIYGSHAVAALKFAF